MERDRTAAGPTLVLMAGAPGAGKTTLALALARALRWPVVDKDTLKSTMLDAGVPDGIAGPASYDLMFAVGRDLLLDQGLSAILDSPAGYPQVIEKAEALAREAGAELRLVLCLAGHPLRNRRLADRTARPSQWTADARIPDDGSSLWIPLLPPGTLTLRTERPIDELLPEILAYVRGRTERTGSRG